MTLNVSVLLLIINRGPCLILLIWRKKYEMEILKYVDDIVMCEGDWKSCIVVLSLMIKTT